jgi:hypothetical protein
MKTITSRERGSYLTRRSSRMRWHCHGHPLHHAHDGAADPSVAACVGTRPVELRLDVAPLPRHHGSLPLQLRGRQGWRPQLRRPGGGAMPCACVSEVSTWMECRQIEENGPFRTKMRRRGTRAERRRKALERGVEWKNPRSQ